MQGKKGNEKPKKHNYEERETGNPGNLPGVRDEYVPNRQKLEAMGR